MRTVTIVMLLVEIERIHIDAKRQRRPRPPGVERRHYPGEAPFKRRQPALRRTLRVGALERLRQGLFIRQAHTAIGIDNVATQRQLITQIVKYLRHLAGGAELQPAGFRMQVKIATPFGHFWRQLVDEIIKLRHNLSCHNQKL